jgi:hypothetical protein
MDHINHTATGAAARNIHHSNNDAPASGMIDSVGNLLTICPLVKPALLGPRTATLNQDDQNNDKQHASYNSNDQSIVHIDSSFP